jgi:phage terminase large subunit-like protein
MPQNQAKKTEIEYLLLLEEEIRRNKKNKLKRYWNSVYDWQYKFTSATKDHTASMLMCANQVGKTRTGITIVAIHSLGQYPDNWPGFKFDFAPTIWLLGFSMEKTRDLLQTPLVGRIHDGKFEGGLIPAEHVIDWKAATGTAGAMREVRVKHEKGIATIKFWSYSQGAHALMGDVIDFFQIDEEPRDEKIFPQVLTRTLNGNRNKGGHGILTFTPENGKTQLVCKFMGEEDEEDEIELSENAMYMQTATWDQAPHLTEGMKKNILAMYPAHERNMRSRGEPLLGSGRIYEIDEDQIKCDPFDVPDYWFVINGMDFGYDHPQAHVQLVWDKDADCFYVINAWKGRKKQPYEAWHIVRPWAENIPTSWPSDGLQTEKGSGKQQKKYYEEEGFWLLDEHATWESGGNGVWAGLVEINNLMKTGRLKIVRTLHDVFEEIRQYHTETKSDGSVKIVKIKDDICDAIRYAYMMRRHAIRVMDRYPEQGYQYTQGPTGRDSNTGY